MSWGRPDGFFPRSVMREPIYFVSYFLRLSRWICAALARGDMAALVAASGGGGRRKGRVLDNSLCACRSQKNMKNENIKLSMVSLAVIHGGLPLLHTLAFRIWSSVDLSASTRVNAS